MATSLERRIEALEAQSGPPGGIQFIFVEFVSPGKFGREVWRAKFRDVTMQRESKETEEAFLDRVKRKAREGQPGGQIATIFFDDLDRAL